MLTSLGCSEFMTRLYRQPAILWLLAELKVAVIGLVHQLPSQQPTMHANSCGGTASKLEDHVSDRIAVCAPRLHCVPTKAGPLDLPFKKTWLSMTALTA